MLLAPTASLQAQDFSEVFLSSINDVRQNGCRCGGRQMDPVGQVTFNNLLEKSAYNHAVEIRSQRRLNHFSRDGKDIGQRVSRVGYEWAVVGENLAYGQRSIREVISDWIESKTHCYLLMDKRFKEVGFAKIGPYWVLHFGKSRS